MLVCCGIFARFALFSGEKNRLQERQKNTLPLPFSLIICARNEAENLRKHLPRILEQQYDGDWELLLVDDDSSDDTAAVVQGFQDEYPFLRLIRLKDKHLSGKKTALQQGILACKYEHVLVSDADCSPVGSGWLAGMAEVLTVRPQTEIVLGYGPMQPSGGGLNRWIRYETTHTAVQYFSFALAGIPYMGVGRNLAFKKKTFGRVGGFEAHLHIPSGDDDLLVNAAADRHNTAICIDPETFVFSEGKTTWKAWLRQKKRHLSASAVYRPAHQWLLASVSISQVFHYFFLLLFLLSGNLPGIPLLFYTIRLIALLLIYARIFSHLKCLDLLKWVPLYDIGITIYYGIFVPYFLWFQKREADWG